MTAPDPPVGVEPLIAWLREHRGDYTEEALRARLLEAGHLSDDVEAAFAGLHAEMAGATSAPATPPGPGPLSPAPTWMPAPIPLAQIRREREALLAFLGAMVLIVGIPLLLASTGTPVAGIAGPAGLVALLLAVVGWGIFRGGGHPGVATGLGTAVAVVVVIPLVAVVAVFGICLVGGGRGV